MSGLEDQGEVRMGRKIGMEAGGRRWPEGRGMGRIIKPCLCWGGGGGVWGGWLGFGV